MDATTRAGGHDWIPPFLTDRGLLEPVEIVDGDVRIFDGHGRHRIARVERDAGPGFLVKRAPRLTPEFAGPLAVEAEFYANGASAGAIGAYLPEFYTYDAARGILVVEFVEDASNLFQPETADAGVTDRLARALVAVRDTPRSVLGRAAAENPVPRRPWILDIHRPAASGYAPRNASHGALLHAIRSHRHVCASLELARSSWVSDGFMHGDMKASNVLVRGTGEIVLVDWENAGTGDPAWDAAGVLQSRVLSTLAQPGHGAPFEVRGFLRGLFGAGDGASWLRSVRYTGARLLQSYLESAAFSARPDPTQPVGTEIAAMLLADPQRGAAWLEA